MILLILVKNRWKSNSRCLRQSSLSSLIKQNLWVTVSQKSLLSSKKSTTNLPVTKRQIAIRKRNSYQPYGFWASLMRKDYQHLVNNYSRTWATTTSWTQTCSSLTTTISTMRTICSILRSTMRSSTQLTELSIFWTTQSQMTSWTSGTTKPSTCGKSLLALRKSILKLRLRHFNYLKCSRMLAIQGLAYSNNQTQSISKTCTKVWQPSRRTALSGRQTLFLSNRWPALGIRGISFSQTSPSTPNPVSHPSQQSNISSCRSLHLGSSTDTSSWWTDYPLRDQERMMKATGLAKSGDCSKSQHTRIQLSRSRESISNAPLLQCRLFPMALNNSLTMGPSLTGSTSETATCTKTNQTGAGRQPKATEPLRSRRKSQSQAQISQERPQEHDRHEHICLYVNYWL